MLCACRPVVQIPWAVNALGAAHSIPGKSQGHFPALYRMPHVSKGAPKNLIVMWSIEGS